MRVLAGVIVTAAGGLVIALLLPLLLIAALIGSRTAARPSVTAVNTAAIPPLAAQHLDAITAITSSSCPELPPIWVIAHVQAESSWNPSAVSEDRNGGAAGLYQLNQANWRDAGGAPWTSTPPRADADILQPDEHLRRAIPWVCANLRTAAAHIRAAGKPTSPLDGMLVCHIAGCARVTQSATGIPASGEAGCDNACAASIADYLHRVHALVDRNTAGPVSIADLPPPAPYGCTATDPTGGRCLTPAARHAHDEITRVFGPAGAGSTIRTAACWDEHAWNPGSDHSRGRACDYFPAAAGRFPHGQELRNGWRLATWLRANATTLNVKYVIWQGRIWSPNTPDVNGWGRPYAGGGVYNPSDPTGGHWDHVHLSLDSAE